MFGTRIGVGQLLLIVPVHALVFAIILIPGIWIFWMSLHEWTLGMKPQFIGLSNYTFVLTDPYFWRAFINTFVVVNVVVYVELALALGMSSLSTMREPVSMRRSTFSPRRCFTIVCTASSPMTGDFDGNGLVDLAMRGAQ